MVSKTGADVVIAGTGIVGCLIAKQMLDAGLSVLMLEAGPRIDRGRIIENYRNMPPAAKAANPDGPFPPKPWETDQSGLSNDVRS
jgi:choline dehydrogenase-like flavoprotein